MVISRESAGKWACQSACQAVIGSDQVLVCEGRSFNKAADDCQTQSRPAKLPRRGGVCLLEGFEDPQVFSVACQRSPSIQSARSDLLYSGYRFARAVR